MLPWTENPQDLLPSPKPKNMALHNIQKFGRSKMPLCQLFGMMCIFPTA
jgi:hypothetical protein